jgi:MFS family permease
MSGNDMPPPQTDISLGARLSLLLVSPLSGLAQSGMTPILPKISEHFATVPNAEATVRLMISGLSFAMIGGALMGGMAGDRFGRRRVLIWMLVIYAIAGVAGYFLDNLYLLIASRMVLGLANACAGIMIAAIFTTRINPSSRDKWLGFLVVSGTVGSIMLLGVVGAVAKVDWHYVFLLHLSSLPVALLILAVLSPSPESSAAPIHNPAVGGAPIGLTLFGIACGVVSTGYLSFVPFHLKHIGYGAPQLVAGVIMTSGLSGAAVSFWYGWIRHRLTAVPVFMLGFAVCAVGLTTIAWATDYKVVLVGIALVGGSVGLIAPTLFSASAASAPPERRARYLGFARAGMYAGPLVAQLPLEPLVRAAGAGAAILAVGGFSAMLAVWVSFGRRLFAPAVN